MENADLYSRLKAAQGFGGKEIPANDSPNKVITLGQALEEAIPDGVKRQKITDHMLEQTITKLVRTTDINTLRMASVSDRVAMKRNQSTPFLNLLESFGPPAVVDDFQYQFDEWNIGSDTADLWDSQGDLPSEAKSNRPRRSNTVTCFGNKLNASLVAMNMAQQQSQVDIMAREIDLEITRIRRKMNAVLLSNTENKIEDVGQIPQMGGFITRSTSYGVNAGAGDVTRTLLQGRIDAIANDGDPEGLGYNLNLVMFCGKRQLQVVRDIILAEYSGIDPMSRMLFEDDLKRRLNDFRVPVYTVFESMPGPVLPTILDSQLPSGTAVIFDVGEYSPRLAKLYLGGTPGPYVLTRPTEKLQRLDVMLDFATLEDPIVASRAVISGLAT